jgi:hypothetical protein
MSTTTIARREYFFLPPHAAAKDPHDFPGGGALQMQIHMHNPSPNTNNTKYAHDEHWFVCFLDWVY